MFKKKKNTGFLGIGSNKKKKKNSNNRELGAAVLGAAGTIAFNVLVGAVEDYGRDRLVEKMEEISERRKLRKEA